MRKHEWKCYAALSMLSLLAALICLPWQPVRFGTVFFGALAIGCAGEAYTLRKADRCAVCKWVSTLGRALFLLFLASFVLVEGMIWAGAQTDEAAYAADYVLVLGAGIHDDQPSATLCSRLDTALGLMKTSDAVFILCGGQGDDEIMPESHVMYNYMTAHGADPARLRVEDTSKNTVENVENAKAFLTKDASTAVITNEFHLARTRRIMARAGLDPVGIAAPTPYRSMLAVFSLREYCSTLKLIASGRYF